MKLNKLEDKRLGVASRDLILGKRSIKGVSDNLNTFNTTDNGEGELNTGGVNDNIGDVLTLSQKKIWNRLNDRKKQEIINKAVKTAGNENVPTFGTSIEDPLSGSNRGTTQSTARQVGKQLADRGAIKNRKWSINQKNNSGGSSVAGNPYYSKSNTSSTKKSTYTTVSNSSNRYGYKASKTVTSSANVGSRATGVAGKAATKSTGIGIAVSAVAKVGKGFTSTLQRGVEQKCNTMTKNLQNQQTQLMSGSTAKEIAVLIIVKVALAAVQMVATILTTIIVTLLPIIIAITAFVAVIGLIAAIASIFTPSGSTGNTLVEVAKYQLESQNRVVGGERYKEWYGIDGDWCAMFVSYCANEAGFIDDGTIPLTASVSVQQQWFIDKGLYLTKESGYKPKAGDIIIFKNGISHTGIVIDYDEETDRVTTIEGNTGASITNPYHMGSSVLECSYSRLASTISGYGTPDYPEGEEGAGPLPIGEGETIELPANLGKSHSYMGWQTITSTTSKQFQLRKDSGMNFDDEGFAVIGERYVIACTTTFGEVGDYIDWYQEDETVIKTIIGDIKNQTDEGCTEWGHNNGQVVVEFVVNKDTWYGTGHANPGTTSCHPEWNQYIIKAINRGNYWRE